MTAPDRARTLRLGDDVNTDDLIPARRCTRADPEHLARYALEHVVGEGRLASDYDRIVAGRNFGCGSSREHAPIALQAAGIRKVRAESFAEIFFRNAVNIGLRLEIAGGRRNDPDVSRIVASGGQSHINRERSAGRQEVPPSATAPRPMTLAEKLIARASGNAFVIPGETVFARVDLAMSHDAVAGPTARLFHREFGPAARVFDPDRIVLVADHFIQVNDVRPDPGATALHDEMRAFARAQGCRLYDVVAPGDAAGICHLLLPEEGWVRPGMLIAGTDSHTCTYGAFGSFAMGVGTTDMANLFATGDVWIRVPRTIRFVLEGSLPPGTSAKDVMLFLLGRIGCDGAAGRVMQFAGSVIDALPMEERMTLANMAIECGAICGLIEPDDRTRAWVADHAEEPFESLAGDPDAEFETEHRFDLSDLLPQVAQPPRPDHVVAVRELGEVAITRAFVGSCTGGKLHDLAEAAAALAGRRIAPGVAMFVVPASQRVRSEAERLGYLATLEEAGAQVLKSGCGACINAGRGTLASDEAGIYATNRNYRGRSGEPSSRHYLASPRVVALSAVHGRITDRQD